MGRGRLGRTAGGRTVAVKTVRPGVRRRPAVRDAAAPDPSAQDVPGAGTAVRDAVQETVAEAALPTVPPADAAVPDSGGPTRDS